MDRNEQFTRLWTHTQPVLAGYIGSLVLNFHEAEDILQEVAIKLQQKFDEYDPGRPFTGWALGFARYEIMASRRRHARSFITYDSEIMDCLSSMYDEMKPELDQRASFLKDCLSEVKNGQIHKVLELRYVDDLPGEEIAERMNMNESAVHVTLHRIRKFLKDCIDRKILLVEGMA